jgi:predicted dienelactone hydrolase
MKKQSAPVVLFSHGLGGTRGGSTYLGQHWSARGYVAVFLQHPGSDESVWKDVPRRERMAAMKKAASGENKVARMLDVPAVLNQLATWNGNSSHPFSGRFNLDQIGMSGHSFGAVTTQAVSGQMIPVLGKKYADQRIKAAISFSPSPPRRGDVNAAFAEVNIPWMLMTGTQDASPLNDNISVEERTQVYPALPDTIDKYQLILIDGQHSAFTDELARLGRNRRNPADHRTILALSTAFWDAYLRNDANALAWLKSEEVNKVLKKGDSWELN